MNQELIDLISDKRVQERRGEWRWYDLGLHPELKKIRNFNDFLSMIPLWLPLPIDPINPERGVWSWIDWRQLGLSAVAVGPTGELEIECYPGMYFEGEPLTVLLKVFLWQQDNK